MAFGDVKQLARQVSLLLIVGQLAGEGSQARAESEDKPAAGTQVSFTVYLPNVHYRGPFDFNACWHSGGLWLTVNQGGCEVDGHRGISGNYLNFLISGVSTLLDDSPRAPRPGQWLIETTISSFRPQRASSQEAIQQWLCEWLRSQWANATLPIIPACSIEYLETVGGNKHELVVKNISLVGSDFTIELPVANTASGDHEPVRYHHALRSIQIIYRRELDESEGIFAD